MTLYETIKWNRFDLDTEVPEVVFYKKGRSWDADVFWYLDYFDRNTELEYHQEELERLEEIEKIDPNAIAFCGETDSMIDVTEFTLKELTNFIRNRYNNHVGLLDYYLVHEC